MLNLDGQTINDGNVFGNEIASQVFYLFFSFFDEVAVRLCELSGSALPCSPVQ